LRLRAFFVRFTVTIVSLAMLAASGGLAWAAADDYASRNLVPSGVTVEGEELGGLTEYEVRETIERVVVKPVLTPVTVRAGSEEFRVDAANYVSVDVDSAVDEAFEPNRDATIADRVIRQIADIPVTHEIVPAIEIDEYTLSRRVAGIASAVDTPSVDASITIEADQISITPSAEGTATVREEAVRSIAEAFVTADVDSVELPVVPVPPAVSDDDLGPTIVIRLGSRTLDLYQGIDLYRTYRIAIGKAGYSTPRGSWEIVAKRYMPTWGNPGSAWAAHMPKTIPPGPGNPLGTRALNLNASGIRIHGTPATGSIGTAASHGCIRMLRRDVEELYDLVEVGTPVLVVSR